MAVLRRLSFAAVAERSVLLAFFTSRLLICVLGYVAFHSIKHGEFQVLPSAAPWNLLFRWDAFWYARIVQRGYEYVEGAQSSVAFFPLFPILVGAFRKLTGAWSPFAGFVISNLSLLSAAVLLRRLLAVDFAPPSRVPERAVWLLLFSPMAFFFSAGYTESLFLALSLGALLCARRGNWAGAAVAGALLTATRGNALLILVPLLWEAVVERRREEAVGAAPRGWTGSPWWLVLVPSGLAAYSAYLHFRFGDALAFAHAQAAFYRELVPPWTAIRFAAAEPLPAGVFSIGTAAVGAALCLLGFGLRIRFSYQLYAAAMLLLSVCSTTLAPLPRLLSVVFPFYLVISVATRTSSLLYALTLIVSTGVMAICLALFVCGYFMT